MKKENRSLSCNQALVGLAAVMGLLALVDNQKPSNNKINNSRVVSEESSDKFSSKESERLYLDYTGGFEGRRLKVYDPNPRDGRPEPTIGIGHYMDRGDSRETFKGVLPEVNYELVYQGRQSLTNDQVDRLFLADIQSYVQKTRKLVPKFDEFPTEVKEVLVDMAYRGDLAGSPKFRKLFNSGNVRDAADELVRREDYRKSIENGMSGIKTRLDSHRQRLLDYSERN